MEGHMGMTMWAILAGLLASSMSLAVTGCSPQDSLTSNGTYDIKTEDKTTSIKADGRHGTGASSTREQEPQGRTDNQSQELSSPEGLVGQRIGMPRESSIG